MFVGATDILGRKGYHVIGEFYKCDENKPAVIGTLIMKKKWHHWDNLDNIYPIVNDLSKN